MKIDFPLAIKVSESQSDEVEFYESLSELVNSDVIVFTGSSYSYDLAMDLIEMLNFILPSVFNYEVKQSSY